MATTDAPIELLIQQINKDFPRGLPTRPLGWPQDIELALIDAIFSARAKYGQPESEGQSATGVQAVVHRWKQHRSSDTAKPHVANDLTVLAAESEESLLRVLGNKSQLSGRTKAQVVIDAANALVQANVTSADDLTDPALGAARTAFLSVRGCGDTLWRYFLMQSGHGDVKPDRWLLHYVRSAVGDDKLAQDAVVRSVHTAAERLNVEVSALDHAIWLKASGRLEEQEA